MNLNNIIIELLQNLIENIQNNNISENELDRIKYFLINLNNNENNNENIKYLFLGWYIYNYVKN